MKLIVLNGKIDSYVDFGDDSGLGILSYTQTKTLSGETVINKLPGVPLGQWANDNLYNKNVSVRYVISDKLITDPAEELSKIIEISMGAVSSEFRGVYSELTGHLWTEEEFTVGGHDVLKELQQHCGKYIHMEIEVH